MKTDRELMQQALEALKLIDEAMPFPVAKLTIKNLRERLAQTDQEPLEYWNAVEGWVKIDEVREHFDSVGCGTIYKTAGDGRVPLTAAQPAPVQEPQVCCGEYDTCLQACTPRGRHLAQRQWVGLTDQERNKLWRDVIKWGDPSHDDVDLMKAIEAKLKEKNGGHSAP
jgi:hypothetical protein